MGDKHTKETILLVSDKSLLEMD